jgi:protein-S-isoprenylcysteine O-methyltransferase Ste14
MNDSTPVQASSSGGVWLQRIPLSLRMLFYSVVFLGFVLGVVPWAFYQIDVYCPCVHWEIGWFRMAGAAFFAVSFSLYLASSYVLTSRGKGAYVEFDPPTELVIVGPYRHVRNPVVAYLLGSMLGEAIALSSTGVLLMFCVFAALSQLQVVCFEEPKLRNRFGQAYDDYCARVPRWIPRFRIR